MCPILVVLVHSCLIVRRLCTRRNLYRHRRCLALLWFSGIMGFYVFRRLSSFYEVEVVIPKRQKHLESKIKSLETSYQTLQQEAAVFSSLLAALSDNRSVVRGAADDRITLNDPIASKLSSGAQTILKNLTNKKVIEGTRQSLRLPSSYSFLPHLRNSTIIQPAYYLSQGRSGVSIVLGIPTVKRKVKSYLVETLRNLLDNMTPKEADDTLIVVLVAEIDSDYVEWVSNELEEQFPKQFETGLIDVISPPAAYYPDFGSLKRDKGDNLARVQWRLKQCLDYAFLMMYAQERGTFYVQLEDDIVSRKNFIAIMKRNALYKMRRKPIWFVLAFSTLGFIGKMFKCAELPLLIEFILMFHNDQPVDWIMFYLIDIISCSDDVHNKRCLGLSDPISLQIYPSLFQHAGVHSSLNGKLQRLTDKSFLTTQPKKRRV